MKNYLLTLATATLLAGSATAQVAFKAPMGKKSQVVSVMQQNAVTKQLGVSTQGQKQLMTLSNSISKRASRVSDAVRSHKELSYQVNGNESATTASVLPSSYKYDEYASYGVSGIGYGQFFDSDMLQRFAGNKISSINFTVYKANYTNCRAVILDGETGALLWEGEEFTPQMFSMTSTSTPVNEVPCDYTITGEEKSLLIGWVADDASADASDTYYSQYGVIIPAYNDNTNAGNGLFMLAMQGSDVAIIDTFAGPWKEQDGSQVTMCYDMTITTTGDAGLKDADAQVYGVDKVYGVQGKQAEGTVSIYNLGLDPIKSFDYEFELNGKKQSSTYTFANPLTFYSGADVVLPALVTDEANTLMEGGKFTVTSVNNVDDEFKSDNQASYAQTVVTQSYNRIPVVEEFTSTNCGWCPRGILGMDLLKEKFPEAIGVAVHDNFGSTDPLVSSTYSQVTKYYAKSFPSAVVNRQYSGDPYYEIEGMVKKAQGGVCEASIVLSSESPLGMSSNVSCSADVTFSTNAPEGAYSLVFGMTEDGITGVNQMNYYASYLAMYKSAGYTEAQVFQRMGWDANEQALAKLGTPNASGVYIYQPTFDHVAVAISDPFGLNAKLPAVEAGKPVHVTNTLTVPSRTGASAVNLDNCSVVAYVIDQATGRIVAAAKAALDEESAPSSIESVESNDKAQVVALDGAFSVTAKNATAEVYSLDGKLVSSCTVNGQTSIPTFGKGVYVIRVVEGNNVITKKATF